MSDAATTLDVDHLRRWIGREDGRGEVLTPELAERYRATLDMPGEAPGMGEAAPALIHFCLAQPIVATAALGADGHASRGGFTPPVPLPRRMWAGSDVTFHGALRVGDCVERRSVIEDVTVKRGRTGVLCFVTIRHHLHAGGALAVEERQDIVYREADRPGRAPLTLPAAEQGEHRRQARAEAPLLFRYSALTFNTHRIHYDRRYATEVEGYPGLVVHGPLQATLLCNYAAELHGASLQRFQFRGVAPLFDDDAFVLHAREDGGRLRLWTAKEGGHVCMTAEAAWE